MGLLHCTCARDPLGCPLHGARPRMVDQDTGAVMLLPDLQTGWICPVCGRGVAPSVEVCPCAEQVIDLRDVVFRASGRVPSDALDWAAGDTTEIDAGSSGSGRGS